MDKKSTHAWEYRTSLPIIAPHNGRILRVSAGCTGSAVNPETDNLRDGGVFRPFPILPIARGYDVFRRLSSCSLGETQHRVSSGKVVSETEFPVPGVPISVSTILILLAMPTLHT